jgi:hypothetical protein
MIQLVLMLLQTLLEYSQFLCLLYFIRITASKARRREKNNQKQLQKITPEID